MHSVRVTGEAAHKRIDTLDGKKIRMRDIYQCILFMWMRQTVLYADANKHLHSKGS